MHTNVVVDNGHAHQCVQMRRVGENVREKKIRLKRKREKEREGKNN
jgi:hypothetical protein